MTDKYNIIGNPIAQAKSPALQMAFARQTGQDISYGTILAEQAGFGDAVRGFQREGGRGMNITMPFKLDAFALADELTLRAQRAGAVNTYTFRPDGTILGDNTDGVGLVNDITRNLKRAIAGQRVLVLGAGGAVRGAILPLLGEQPAEIFIANRTPAKAAELVQLFADDVAESKLSGGGFEDIQGCFDIVINGTPTSMTGSLPPLPAGVWNAHSLAYDMSYETAFIEHAAACGLQEFADGLGMVVEQGAECFMLWRGIRPDTVPVIAELRAARGR